MTRQRVILWAFPPILALMAVLATMPGKSQEQTPRQSKQPRHFDETRFPVADYLAVDPTEPTERAKRQTRGKKYNSSSWGLHPNAASDSVVRVDSVDPSLPALPFEKSSAVVVGQVTNATAYLSNDKGGVYSVFTVQVNEVLKKSTTPLSTASVIEVAREGGRVRFPNERIRIYMVAENGMPKVGLRYVLFLSESESGFEIVTGYELAEGKVNPLDDLPNPRVYENNDELTFLSHLRSRIK
jgi:hypothetical protein